MKFLKPKIYRLKAQDNWTLAYIHPETKKRIRKRFPTKRDATIHLNELVNTFIREEENFLKRETLNDIVQEYAKRYPTTKFFKIKKVVNRFMQEFGNYHPKEITPYMLRDWFLQFMKEEDSSLKAMSNYRTQLKTIFTYMKRYGYQSESPMNKIRFKTKMDVFRSNHLSQQEIAEIFEYLNYMSPYYLFRFISMIYHSLMTKMEIIELKWEHVDLQRRIISVIHPRAGFVRNTEITDEVLKIIQLQPKRNEYVFTNRYGRKINADNFHRNLIHFRELFPHIKFFNLDNIRAAGGFHFIEKGGGFEELRKRLNHDHIDITKRLYSPPKGDFYVASAATKEQILAADWGIEILN